MVEGYTPDVALHEGGIENVGDVGHGAHLRHIRILSRHASKRIVYLFDGDAAGQRAADRALQFIDDSMTPEAGKSRIEVCAVTLPDDLDPPSSSPRAGRTLSRAPRRGDAALQYYGIERRLAAHSLETAEGRTRALADALSILAPIKDSLLAKDYAVQIAGRVRAREQDVLDQLSKLVAPLPMRAPPRCVCRSQRIRPSSSIRSGFPSPRPRVETRPAELSVAERNRCASSAISSVSSRGTRFSRSCTPTPWRARVGTRRHATLAESMLQTLVDDPAATTGKILDAAARACPHAPSVLTSSTQPSEADPEKVVAYLAEELEIGDAEDAIAEMKNQRLDAGAVRGGERSSVQRDRRHAEGPCGERAAHKPLAQP